MNAPRQRSRPVQMLVALLYGAAAGHTAFVVGLLWLRPGLDASGIASLLFLPFFYVLLAFVPVVVVLTGIRLVLAHYLPAFVESLGSTLLLALIGFAAAVGVAFMTLGWMPPGTDVFQAILLGASIGGIVSGYMVSKKGMLEEGS